MIEKNGFSIYMNCDAQSKEAYAAELKKAYKNPDQVNSSLNDGTYTSEDYAKMYFVFTGKNVDEDHNYSWSNGDITAADILNYCEDYASMFRGIFADDFQDVSFTSNYIVTED